MEYARVACATLVGVVFVASAVSKVRDFGGFARSLPALVPVARRLVRPLAAVVLVAEAAVPVLLVVPPATSYGFAVGGVLFAAFTAAIAVALRHGRLAPCRCFGASSAPIGPRHLARNGALLIIAVAGGLAPHGLPPLPALSVAAVAGLIGAILIVSFDDIVDLFARSS